MSIDGTIGMSGAHETEHTRAMTRKDQSPFDVTNKEHEQSIFSEVDGTTMLQGSIREDASKIAQKTIQDKTPMKLFETKAARSQAPF